MHADEREIDAALARSLLGDRFAGLPLRRVWPAGTDNAVFRLGDELAVRIPRRAGAAQQPEREHRWLPVLAPHLSLPIPVPVLLGDATADLPWRWTVCRWVDGDDSPLARGATTASDLARFLLALQAVDASDAPASASRGGPLAERDAPMRAGVETLRERIDERAVLDEWEAAVAAPRHDGPAVWLHGDLDARNVVVREGRLAGVIDWGTFGIGDPASDVMVAWKLLDPDARAMFRELLGVDDATWARARGWAVSQAVIALAYYTPENNPSLVSQAESWLDNVLGDPGA